MAAKDSASSQLLLEQDHFQKSSEEISILLKKSEVERDVYCEDCREARTRIHELEAKVKEMTDELLETRKIREKLTHVLSELKATEEEILRMETQLATAREVNLKALAEAELMATAANMEKKRFEELVKHVVELNEAILVLKLASIEAEKEKCMVLSDKDARLESAMEMATQAQEQLKADLIVKERDNSDQTFYFGALETELNQLKEELKNENEEASHLSRSVEILMDELQEVKTKMYEIKEREKEAQIEVAVLKSELHKGRSELSAAEARTGSVKFGLYLAVQQLAVEAEAAERKNQRLKGLYKRRNENDGDIKISLEEYEFLIRKAEKAGEFLRRESSNMSITSENKYETQLLKKELEIAIVKNRELRTRLEQAVTRAEAAEKATTILEDQQKRRQEQKQRIKAAIVGLREESTSRELSS
ncbi:hypothetical protein NC652_034865 [Populus alba x Populus x berolinensis]|nr:hypothetical protein NC652_034865 [Populus alba x Populus x berolinensis]